MFLLNMEENGKVRNNTSEDNTLQATSSRFSLFHLFTMQQHKITICAGL